jgi:HEAT repeat protein
VPEFLCDEIESRDAVEALLPLLDSEDETTVEYAVNMLLGDRRAYDTYLRLLEEDGPHKDALEDIVDILKADADFVKNSALILYKEGKGKEYALEILSRVKEREEEIFGILLTEFLQAEELTPMRASYLAAYGDERALPYLLERIEDRTIGFVEFQELKYAIEALGGEYDEPRDFSDDKDYIAVEAVNAKTEIKS